MENPLPIKSAMTIAIAVILSMFPLLTGFLESADARARQEISG